MKSSQSLLKSEISSKYHFLDYIFYFGILVVVFALFSSFRLFGLGPDYDGYLAIFYGDESTEPAFRLLKIINNYLNPDEKTLKFIYFFCAFIGLFLKGIFFKRYSNNFILSILLYLSTIYFLHEYTQIRAAIGLGICFLSVEEINNRDFKKFVVRILFAMLFHYSCVIMFFVYFYCNFFKKQKTYLKILWISFFVCILLRILFHGQNLIEILGNNFFSVLFFARKMGPQTMGDFSVFNVGYLLSMILNTIYFFVYRGFKEKNFDFRIFQLSSLSSIIFYGLYNLGFQVVVFRLSEFFIPFLFIVIPKILSRFKEKILLAPFVFIIFAYYFKTFARAVFI